MQFSPGTAQTLPWRQRQSTESSASRLGQRRTSPLLRKAVERRTLHLRCMIEKPPEKGTKSPGRCPFECNAIEGDASAPPAQVRITKCVSHHGCSQGHGRKRAVPLSVRRAQSTTLESFIPVANRRGGNVAQLQEVARQQDGIHVKKGQVCNALQGKSGTICAHLASHRILHSPH